MAIYDFSINKPSGESLDLHGYHGQLILVVNTATKCGFSPQLRELEDLHIKYGDKGLTILGIPCNQFANQEPHGNEEMEAVCARDYGVSFQLTEKTEVNGKQEHPLFSYLKRELPGKMGKAIKWNFTKFLISAEGKPLKRYGPRVRPMNIEEDIKRLIQDPDASIPER